MKVVQVAIDTLVPADYNPRQWSEAEITALDRSLKKFGFVEPILVNSNAKRKNVIVGGHFRCARWAALGNTMVPAVFLDLTEKKERELNVRLNRNTGSFDYRLLKEHFGTRDLIDYGFDVPTLMENSFDIPADLLPVTSGKDPDETPPVPEKAVSVLGDVWTLGRHRLLCASSSREEARAFFGSPDCVLTDPPYCSGGFQEGGKSAGSVGTSATHKQIANDRLSTRGYQSLMTDAVFGIPSQFFYVFTDWRMWISLFDMAEASGAGVRSMIVWDKGTPGMGRGWRAQHELILWACRDTPPYPHKFGGDGNVLSRKRTGNLLHTTEKPVNVIQDLIKGVPFAKTIADPFGGSGTTLIACEIEGVTCLAAELDPLYVDVTVKRWQDFTGKQAIHEGTGLTFEELTKKRSKGK